MNLWRIENGEKVSFIKIDTLNISIKNTSVVIIDVMLIFFVVNCNI